VSRAEFLIFLNLALVFPPGESYASKEEEIEDSGTHEKLRVRQQLP
jgi:hypothetical protein